MKRPLAVAIGLALATQLLLLGCGKDNPVKPKDDPQPFVYPDQSTPDKTLLRMVAAFERRDSVMTDSVYASDYAGTSIDMTDAFPVTLAFTESDEIGLVWALAQSTDISYISMDFKTPTTWSKVHYASDPPGWIAIQIHNFQITVSDTYGNGYNVRSPSSGETWIFEFTLRPTPDSSSPTDTTWTIVRWVESRSQN